MREYDFSIFEDDGKFGVNRLKKEYPFMIDSASENYNPLYEMPVGWLYAFGEEMLKDLRTAMGEHVKNFHCLQIKEKWGELVIYFDRYSSEVENVIHKYSMFSKQFCAKCGLPLKKEEKMLCKRCLNEEGVKNEKN